MVGKALGRSHCGQGVVVLLASTTEQLPAILEHGGHVEGLQAKLVVAGRGSAISGVLVPVMLQFDVGFIVVGVVSRSVVDDTSDGLGSCHAGVPLGRAKEGHHPREKIEKVIGMLFLELGKLLSRGISN